MYNRSTRRCVPQAKEVKTTGSLLVRDVQDGRHLSGHSPLAVCASAPYSRAAREERPGTRTRMRPYAGQAAPEDESLETKTGSQNPPPLPGGPSERVNGQSTPQGELHDSATPS